MLPGLLLTGLRSIGRRASAISDALTSQHKHAFLYEPAARPVLTGLRVLDLQAATPGIWRASYVLDRG